MLELCFDFLSDCSGMESPPMVPPPPNSRTRDDEYLRAAVFLLNLIYSFEAEKRFNICSEVRQTGDGKRR
ncbi:hypothetical protein D5086_032597 [Populus alba]|uniref:Uncharacterized protein n=1 Tax=Populus alba TaxID=43335 RepID=A0ACC4ALU1_POPAL